MPLVAHSALPSFGRLKDEGEEILDVQRARHQDIRELHIGLLNLMPDAALEATERQFMRLIGSCNRIVQFFVHPLTLPGIARDAATAAHIEAHYRPFSEIAAEGLDALIITGANLPAGDIQTTSFWHELVQVLEFAQNKVTSTLCACLASHAALLHSHGLQRQALANKCWGVFAQRADRQHPLTRNINTLFDVPHSRHHDISRASMEQAGVRVLVHSEQAGAHLAVSPDGMRFVYCQGHLEYDRLSIFKEYKREIGRFAQKQRSAYPQLPVGYFCDNAQAIAHSFQLQMQASQSPMELLQHFPETTLAASIDNTWGDTARAIVNNWLGLVYQTTGFKRSEPFTAGVDPLNPLGLPAAAQPF